jgi:hypothetical protein
MIIPKFRGTSSNIVLEREAFNDNGASWDLLIIGRVSTTKTVFERYFGRDITESSSSGENTRVGFGGEVSIGVFSTGSFSSRRSKTLVFTGSDVIYSKSKEVK